MWNKSISLVIGQKKETDADGFDTVTEECMNGIPTNFTDVTRNDEIVANQFGYSADQNIEITACNYNGQRFLYDESDGVRYEVKRTFRKDKSMNIILTCERRERGG